jgi:hypothetical protein
VNFEDLYTDLAALQVRARMSLGGRYHDGATGIERELSINEVTVVLRNGISLSPP